MYSIRQLIRQPVKTLLGIALIATAVATACICGEQVTASKNIANQLDGIFQSAIFPTGGYTLEADTWALSYGQDHPEVVKDVSAPGLTTAYIRELTPDNRLESKNVTNPWYEAIAPYDCAMLEITLTEIGEVVPGDGTSSVKLTGVIEDVIGLQEGYPDCMGFYARLNLELTDSDDPAALDLQIGERYLVYCTGYRDLDFLLRRALCEHLAVDKLIEWREADSLVFFSPEEIKEHNSSGYGLQKIGRISIANNVTYLYDYQVEEYRSIEGNVAKPASTWSGSDYPTMVHLSGTAEEYLSSAEGAVWRDALENIQVNNHAFPVVATNDLGQLANFLTGVAEITSGREFTDEEVKNGAKVCIVSDTLAEKNGLALGDTVTMEFYDGDEDLPGQIHLADGSGNTNPVGKYYFAETTSLYEAETYTIVGIYKRGVDWVPNTSDAYAFTPNTIFVPESAVVSELERGYRGLFRTFILNNGTEETFALEAASQGYNEMLTYYDNGYSNVSGNLQSYQEMSSQILTIGGVAYVTILALFFVFFFVQQSKALVTMDSLGAGRGGQLKHLVCSGLGTFVPGTILGAGIAVAVWNWVQEKMMGDLTMVASTQQDMALLCGICFAQLVLSVGVILSIGAIKTKHTGLTKRK